MISEGYKVVRYRRPSASVRRKRRQQYRKRRSKLKRYAKRYRNRSSTKRRMKRLKVARKRMHLRPGRRLRMAGVGSEGNIMEISESLQSVMSGLSSGMKDMFLSYLETALWSSTDESDPNGGEPMDKNYSYEDIDDDTLKVMLKDCKKFWMSAPELKGDYSFESLGHDFWLTRNRHGAGFWDGDYEKEDGVALTDLAHKFGEFNLYVGDDGKIYGDGSSMKSEMNDNSKIQESFSSDPIEFDKIADERKLSDFEKFLKDHKLEDQVTKEEKEDDKVIFSLKPEVIKDLEHSYKVFTDGEAYTEYEEEIEKMVKEIVKEKIGSKAKKIEAKLVGDSSHAYIQVSVNDGSYENVNDLSYQNYSSRAMEAADEHAKGHNDWDWAAWFADERSPLFDQDWVSGYDDTDMALWFREIISYGDNDEQIVTAAKESMEMEESKVTKEIQQIQESINEFKTFIDEKSQNHLMDAFKASARVATKLVEAYEKIEKPVVSEKVEVINEFDIELPDFVPDHRTEMLSESFEEVLGVKKVVVEESAPNKKDNTVDQVIIDLKQIKEHSEKLSVHASKNLLDESEAKDFLKKARQYMGDAMSMIDESKDPKDVDAAIGRKKYGKEKFAKIAATGRKKHESIDEAIQSGQVFNKDNKFFVKDQKTGGYYELHDQNKARDIEGAMIDFEVGADGKAQLKESLKDIDHEDPKNHKEMHRRVGVIQKELGLSHPDKDQITKMTRTASLSHKNDKDMVAMAKNVLDLNEAAVYGAPKMSLKYKNFMKLIRKDGHNNPILVTQDEIRRIAKENKVRLSDDEVMDIEVLVHDHLKESIGESIVGEAKLDSEAILGAIDAIKKIADDDKELNDDQRELISNQLEIIHEMVKAHDEQDLEGSVLNAKVIKLCADQIEALVKESSKELMGKVDEELDKIVAAVAAHEALMKEMGIEEPKEEPEVSPEEAPEEKPEEPKDEQKEESKAKINVNKEEVSL